MQEQPPNQNTTAIAASAEARPAPSQPNAAPRRLHWAAIAGIALAQVLAYAGQSVLARANEFDPILGSKQALAGSLLIAAALLFGAGARRLILPGAEPKLPPPQARRAALGWLLAAMALSVAATGLFAARGESPAVVIAWLASMAALLGSQLWGRHPARLRIAPEQRPYLAGLGVLLLLGLLTRAYRLATLPYNLDGDFASVGLQARAMLKGEVPQIFAYGWASIPVLGYGPAWLSMAVFGDTLAGLNASGVIEGLLIVVGVFLLGRELFHARVGLIAAALLTISYTHLAASRQAAYLDPVVALVFAIYFLLIGLRDDRGWAIVASGMLTALCFQLYYSGRLVVVIVGFMLLHLLLFRRQWLWKRRWSMPLWALALLISTGPMLVLFARDSNAFLTRTREVFILSPHIIVHEQNVYKVTSITGILLQQARRTALLFHYYRDTGTQFGLQLPFLDPLTAIFFTLGIGYALFRWRQLGAGLLLGWTGLGMLIGCFLTANPPFWPRLLVLLAPTALLAALPLALIYEYSRAHFGSVGRRAAPVLLAVLLAGGGWLNWNAYVAVKGRWATPRTFIGRYLAEQPPDARAYLISANYTFADREFQFLAPGRLVANLKPEQLAGTIAPAGTPTLVIVAAESAEQLQQLQQRYPGQAVEQHSGNDGNQPIFYVMQMPDR